MLQLRHGGTWQARIATFTLSFSVQIAIIFSVELHRNALQRAKVRASGDRTRNLDAGERRAAPCATGEPSLHVFFVFIISSTIGGKCVVGNNGLLRDVMQALGNARAS